MDYVGFAEKKRGPEDLLERTRLTGLGALFGGRAGEYFAFRVEELFALWAMTMIWFAQFATAWEIKSRCWLRENEYVDLMETE